MKTANQRYMEVSNKRINLTADITNCGTMVRELNVMHETLLKNNSEYIDTIIQMIQDAVEFAINKVLPLKKYKVSLTYKPYRNDGQLKLYLINENGLKLPPKIIEGDMLNQVLSFSAVVHITLQKGYDTIFYDEAFSSANVRSLVLINSVIQYYSEQGVKFVLVTQNPILYAGLDRTMVQLVSDGKQIVDVEVKDIAPMNDELDTIQQVTDLFDFLTDRKE